MEVEEVVELLLRMSRMDIKVARRKRMLLHVSSEISIHEVD